jgi:hypothetical protein
VSREILQTIKEVQEGGKFLANYYLERGYVLLDIQQAARARKFPQGGRNAGKEYYVYRNPIYIVGRPEDIEPASPPPRRPWEENQKGDEDELQRD